jgi:hypothetical protein
MGKKYSKFELYEASVQDSGFELDFFQRVYKNTFGKKPVSIREDFCSTFLNSVSWVLRNKENVALAVDINPIPLDYGKKTHLRKLNWDQQERLHLFQANVLNIKTRPVDLITISNFSIFFLKQRQDMLAYFKNCYATLKNKGAIVFDMLGGEELPESGEDVSDFKLQDGTKAKYYWEHAKFNPITNEAMFYIHYKVHGQKKMNRVFSYDWRIWSISEFRDLLIEAGFDDVNVYWEGDDPRSDGGNGVFSKVTSAKSCPIWLAYMVGIKR